MHQYNLFSTLRKTFQGSNPKTNEQYAPTSTSLTFLARANVTDVWMLDAYSELSRLSSSEQKRI